MLKRVIEEMLEAAETRRDTSRVAKPVQRTLMRQRNSSAANLHELNALSSAPPQKHYQQHRYIHKQLEEIEEIENKVFREILMLRDEKLQLMRDLNEETRRAN